MARKALRAVAPDERPAPPPGLLEAVESGDVLQIMRAQRRIIAEAMVGAAENTKPQYSNELNKLNALIAAEEAKRELDDDSAASAANATTARSGWDQSAI